MKNFFVQRLMYATGLDKKILAEHENLKKNDPESRLSESGF